jgi:hypothetical protein
MEDQRMESSAAVGSLKRNSRRRELTILATVQYANILSHFIPLDHKVSDALLVNLTSLL